MMRRNRKIYWKTASPLAAMLGVWFAYNRYSPPSLLIAVGFHYALFSYGVFAFSALIIGNIRNGVEVGRRNARIRFVASNIIAIAVVCIAMYNIALLLEETLAPQHNGYLSGRYVVTSWHSHLFGPMVGQNVNLENVDDGSRFHGLYFFRIDLLRNGDCYDIVYGAKTRNIYLAVRSSVSGVGPKGSATGFQASLN